jgi:hypothetical protein
MVFIFVEMELNSIGFGFAFVGEKRDIIFLIGLLFGGVLRGGFDENFLEIVGVFFGWLGGVELEELGDFGVGVAVDYGSENGEVVVEI